MTDYPDPSGDGPDWRIRTTGCDSCGKRLLYRVAKGEPRRCRTCRKADKETGEQGGLDSW